MKKLSKIFLLSFLLLVSIPTYQAIADSNQSELSVLISDTTYESGDSVIHVSTNNTPPLFYNELPTKTGGTLGTFIWSLLGLVIVYVLSWKEKQARDKEPEKFDVGIWMKHNIGFFFLYVSAFAVLYWSVGSMHPLAAITIGFSAPKMIEQLRKMFGSTT